MSRPPTGLDRRALLRRGVGAGLAAGLGVASAGCTAPSSGGTEPEQEGPAVERIAYGSGELQFGELLRPIGEPKAVVVTIHGGFWQSQYTLTLQEPTNLDLVARGYATWNLEYRSVGSGGGWPATFDDIRAGVAKLAELESLPAGLRTAPPIVLGHSAGGHLAAWVAGELPVAAAVPLAGVVDIAAAARERLGGGAVESLLGPQAGREQIYRDADPTLRVPLDAPVRAVHGTVDSTVPISQSESYVAALTAADSDAELISLPADHFDAITPTSDMWQRTVAAIDAIVG